MARRAVAKVPATPSRTKDALDCLLISLRKLAAYVGVPPVISLRRYLAEALTEGVNWGEAKNSTVYYRTADIKKWLQRTGIIRSTLNPDLAGRGPDGPAPLGDSL